MLKTLSCSNIWLEIKIMLSIKKLYIMLYDIIFDIEIGTVKKRSILISLNSVNEHTL